MINYLNKAEQRLKDERPVTYFLIGVVLSALFIPTLAFLLFVFGG